MRKKVIRRKPANSELLRQAAEKILRECGGIMDFETLIPILEEVPAIKLRRFNIVPFFLCVSLAGREDEKEFKVLRRGDYYTAYYMPLVGKAYMKAAIKAANTTGRIKRVRKRMADEPMRLAVNA